MSAPASPAPARLRLTDLTRLAAVGLRTRKLRAGLSALGIAIGVAAIVAVLGLSSSSQAGLLAEIAKLGTNLLTVQNGQTLTGGTAELPKTAPGMISDLPGVTAVQDTGTLSNVSAYRSPLIPSADTNALSVQAASLGLPAAVGTSIAQGSYLNAADAKEPVAVLGAAAAQRLGVDKIWPGERIWTGGMWFYVTGILKPAVLAPEIDSSVLIGYPAAEKYLHYGGHPTIIYLRGHQPGRPGRQPARRPGQSRKPLRSRRLPALRRAHRPSRGQRRVRHPVPGPGRGRAAGRHGRRRQHHGHFRAGTALGDRAAPRPRRHQGPDPHPVPVRGHPARLGWRHRRRRRRRRRDRHLRPHQGLGHCHPRRRLGRLLPALRAARLSPTEALWSF